MTAISAFIVDDAEAVRQRLQIIVQSSSRFSVTGQAATVEDAVPMILDQKPDVVFLDMRLPDGTGIDVLRQLSFNGWKPVIIVLTNYPYPQYREKCLKLGADLFFDKSTEFPKIPATLERLFPRAGKPAAEKEAR